MKESEYMVSLCACVIACSLIYVDATCLVSTCASRREQKEIGIQTPWAPMWGGTDCVIFKLDVKMFATVNWGVWI